MTNKSKAKGTRWESAIRDWLNTLGFTTWREAQHGAKDQGDIMGIPYWTLEAKDEKTITLAAYMKELEAEIANHDTTFGAVIVKRKGKGVADAYAVMPLARLVMVIRELERCRSPRDPSNDLD